MTKRIIALDDDNAKNIQKQLNSNGGYCPCKLVKNDDTKCMCKDFRELIKSKSFNKPGEYPCHCGLYKIVIYD